MSSADFEEPRFSDNNLQKPQQENPRQRNLLRPSRPQGPNHGHRQAQDHDVGGEITDAGANGEVDSAHASCRLGILYLNVPEGADGYALKQVSEQDGDPPGEDHDGGGVYGYSETARGGEETVVEQE